MTDQLISFETAKLAKEKGFDEPTYNYWWDTDPKLLYGNYKPSLKSRNSNSCGYLLSAPTQSLLQKWLREKYNLMIFIILNREFGYVWSIMNRRDGGFYKTYEEALEQGLIEALKLMP